MNIKLAVSAFTRPLLKRLPEPVSILSGAIFFKPGQLIGGKLPLNLTGSHSVKSVVYLLHANPD